MTHVQSSEVGAGADKQVLAYKLLVELLALVLHYEGKKHFAHRHRRYQFAFPVRW